MKQYKKLLIKKIADFRVIGNGTLRISLCIFMYKSVVF